MLHAALQRARHTGRMISMHQIGWHVKEAKAALAQASVSACEQLHELVACSMHNLTLLASTAKVEAPLHACCLRLSQNTREEQVFLLVFSLDKYFQSGLAV